MGRKRWVEIADLAALGDRAVDEMRWAELARVALVLTPLMPKRSALLARQIAALVGDGDGKLAAAVWQHVADVARHVAGAEERAAAADYRPS